MQAENVRFKSYTTAIAEATGAPSSALGMIEEIMRSEVFHSTLDWQSAEEFQKGARRAYQLYLADREFYQADAQYRRASFRLFSATERLKTLQNEGDASARLVEAQAEFEAARIEEAAARISLEEHLAS